MYSRQRNPLLPSCRRIQEINRPSSMATKNILSSSLKWAIEKIETCGFPESEYRKFSIRSGSPCVQPLNAGLARILLSCMARSIRLG